MSDSQPTTRLRKGSSIVALILLAVSSVAFCQGPLPGAERFWFWFGDCTNGKLMGVELLVEGQVMYRSSFRACLMERTSANTERERRIRAFHFSGGHTFQDRYHTTKGEQVEGNIWQAGADPNDILLGVSFTAHNRILLNTIHIVRPGKPMQSTLDRDVVMKTYPLTPKAQSLIHR